MIDLFRLLCDFGLVVLIWMVQLLIYPSFKYYQKQDLLVWHKLYMPRIACVVIPLMFGQLGLAVTQVVLNPSILNSTSLLLVIIIWIHTFIYFAPAHQKISNANFEDLQLSKLVHLNWWRTTIWTFVFLLSLLQFQF